MAAEKVNAVEVLSKVTGLRRQEMDDIFRKVKANQALLDSCPNHDFSVPIDRHSKKPLPERNAFCDWECRNCHGWVDGLAKRWYEKGKAHAQNPPAPGNPR